MLDYRTAIADAENKLGTLLDDSMRNVILALLRDYEYCRPLEKMDKQSRAKCSMAMNVIHNYMEKAMKIMKEDLRCSLLAITSMSIWPETRDEISAVLADTMLSELRDRMDRSSEKEIGWIYHMMIEDLRQIEALG